MKDAARTFCVPDGEVIVSGLTWTHSNPKYTRFSIAPLAAPGGYPSAYSASSIRMIEVGLESELVTGSLRWPSAIAYVTGLSRWGEWLYAADRVSPGNTWDFADLDPQDSLAFLAHVKARWSKSQLSISKAVVLWAYDRGVRQDAAGFDRRTFEAVKLIRQRDLGSPEAEGGAVCPLTLPCEPGLPAVPVSFSTGGTPVVISGTQMRCGSKIAGLERILRPAGRPPVLGRRCQQLALLFTTQEIAERRWSRHQILNAVDRFGQFLGWHPDWAHRTEAFEWSNFTAPLAEEYFRVVREEPKGTDWWIFLRSLYRWGLQNGFEDFDADVERAVMNVGAGRARTCAPTAGDGAVQSRFVPDEALPPIPLQFCTRDQAHYVRCQGPIWRQRNEQGEQCGPIVNLALLDDPAAGPGEAIYTLRLLHLVRLYLVRQGTKNWAWSTLIQFVSMLQALQAWLRTHRQWEPDAFGVADVTGPVLFAYKTYLESAEGPGYSSKLSMFRVFYRWGSKEKVPGFSKDVLASIEELSFKNPPHGELIRSLDPMHGAFNMTEQRALHDALEDSTWGTAEEKALVRLCWYLGPRPVQISAIRVKHFAKYITSHGITYVLRVPQAKEGHATSRTVPRGITEELGQLLEGLCPPGADAERVLFPSLRRRAQPEAAVNEVLRRWAWRSGPRSLRTRRVLEENGAPARLPIHSYRFRRTMATNMARQGASAEHIAHMLDDSDIRMALVYAENVSSIVKVLGDTLDAGEYLDIIGGFFGEFETTGHSSLPVVQAGVINGPGRDELLNLGGTGRCGAGALCDLAWPMSCYGCRKFKPRPGGPHKEMLANMDRVIEDHTRQGLHRMVVVHRHVRERIAIVVEAERRIGTDQGLSGAEEGIA